MSSMEVDPPSASADVSASSGGSKKGQGSAQVQPMDTQPAGSSGGVMAAASVQGSVSISIHPLVVLNISEHFTRVKAQEKKAQPVFGAILGKQKGRSLELVNSFELLVTEVGGLPVVDTEFFRTRDAQYKEVFPKLEFLGWYTTGDAPNETDIGVHRQITEIVETPIFLKLSPEAKNTHENLPVRIFESVIDLVEGDAKMFFISLPYTLVTEEAERIGVDHVARISRASTGELSMVTEQLVAEFLAIKMLHSRITIILRYMEDVAAGKLEPTHGILREVKSLCCRLPVITSEKFSKQFYYQSNDVALIAYLGALTKTCDAMNQLVNKLNVIQDSRGYGGKRLKGLFM